MAEENVIEIEKKDEEEELQALDGSDDSDEQIDDSHEFVDEGISDVKNELTEEEKRNKKKRAVATAILTFLIILIVIISFILVFELYNEPKKKADVNTTKIINKIQEKTDQKERIYSKLDSMIKKANTLYDEGSKKQALKIYADVATFNEAMSNYNLGVAQMKEKDYKEALESFRKAIRGKENRTVSAINAAVCSLELNQTNIFKFYIDLAYSYLPEESNSPLYSYYSGLVNYYKNFYIESLASLSHKSSKFYSKEQDYLASKIASVFKNERLAIKNLEKHNDIQNALPLGLLYARIGDFSQSKAKLQEAINFGQDFKKATFALSIVEAKLGNFGYAAVAIKDLFDKFPEEIAKIYIIKAKLKNQIFDVHSAQLNYKNQEYFSREKIYKILFYFAPYKVFDAKQSMAHIEKGGMNIFLDEAKTAIKTLKNSSTISRVNLGMTEAINLALGFNIARANEKLRELLKSYPNHSILHYNLALTYAQLGNFSQAKKHFTTSYHLDLNNNLAASFALICSDLLKIPYKKLLKEFKENLTEMHELDKPNLEASIMHLLENNQLALTRWLEESKKITPLSLAFDMIIANEISNEQTYQQRTKQLLELLPKDLIANILYFHSIHKNDSIKQYAKAIQLELINKDIDLSSFYLGTALARDEYVKILQFSGLLHHERKKIKQMLETKSEDLIQIMQSLAYIDIYTNNFEESFMLYNKLIDDFKQQDSVTVFLAAIAAIGAKHPENAIALLELAKLTDPNNKESRFALALLYQEIKNFEGAAIEYSKIGNSGFKSNYFDFDVK